MIAGHVERVADDCFDDVVLAKDTGYGFEVGAAVGSMQREEGLRGEAERVRESDANAAVTDIEAYDARWQIAG